MRLILPLTLVLIPFLACAQKPAKLQIIPEPVATTVKSGVFTLNSATSIAYPTGQKDVELAAQYLAGIVQPATGFPMVAKGTTAKAAAKNQIFFELNTKKIKQKEGYLLEVGSNGITVTVASGAGAFYAVQTIRQLLPPEINAPTIQQSINWTMPNCTVEDFPRFQYRGLLLDVGRHWFPVSSIKRYIDLLAMHKMNRFHWHLTDDQGWRIEIKKYPKLQQVSSCRVQTLVGHYGEQPAQYDGIPYCHYYTQAEVKEVVEYAKKRFVTVVPEIEMPGHALAALAAYPYLGCEGSGYSTATTWGVHEEVYCAGKEDMFTFINDVFAEIVPLFPGEYVHVGGDECPKDRWKECANCQKRIKKEGLKDEHELQSYVIKRAEQMLAKYGKKLIGWDEILEGGLSPNATVMSWRGIEGGIAAAKAGHDAIMTPTSHCYLDYYQSDPNQEPLAIGGLLTLEKTYEYEPIPDVLTPAEAKHILGVQGNIWTEYIKSPDYLDYMTYPRACALAEIAWSPAGKRSWETFKSKVPAHFERLAAYKVNFAKSFYDVTPSFSEGLVTLTCNDPSVQVRYTTDGSAPTNVSPLYTQPFILSKSSVVKASAWRGGTALGKILTANYLVHKASGKAYTMSKVPTKFLGGDTYGLTNGVLGGSKTWDGWVGLVNRDIDPVIDLGAVTAINRVTTHYLDNKQSWIHPPRSIEVLVSDDGKNFRSVGKKAIEYSDNTAAEIKTIVISTPNTKTRFVKLVATTTGVIPEPFPGAKEGAWLFLDEVIVD